MTRSLNVVFAGTPDFSVPSMAALHRWCDAHGHRLVGVYTQPDRPAGRGRSLRQSPVKEWALKHSIDVFQPLNFKLADDVDELRLLQPHLMVVVAYGLLLPKSVLEAPTLGCLNVHASLLPRWRGAAPIQRAIAAGDAASGVCIMQMDEGLDTGPVWSSARIDITARETGGSLHDRLAQLGAEQLTQTLPHVLAATTTPTPQTDAGITYAHKLTKQEALIDWSQSAQHIQRTIRAFNPWPIAHTTLDGRGLRVFEAECVDPELVLDQQALLQHQPGTVVDTDDHMIVATGHGLLKITVLQPAGSRAMDAIAFLNSNACLQKTLGADEALEKASQNKAAN